MMQIGQYAPPRHVIAHLSDPHLRVGDDLQYGVIDTAGRLELALARLAGVEPPPQVLVFTGDLADKAEPDAYARLRGIVEPAAAAMGAEVIWVIGNHDERADYSHSLFGQASDAPQDRVHEVDGLRIISLDTTVPGYHHGELSNEQLAWLADVLATPAEHGTLLAMHHPPIPLPMLRAAELIELLDQDRLAAVLAGTDVRGILAGHLHFSTYSTFAGIPVSVCSASCYTCDVAATDRIVSGVDEGQAFNMVHAYDDRLVHTIVPLKAGPEVNGIGLEILSAMEDLSVEEAREMASNKTSPFNLGK